MKHYSLKLIIFDLDGTLVNAYGAVTASLNFAFRQLKLPAIDHATVKKNVGWGEKNLVRKLVPANFAAQALSLYRQHHAVALKSKVKFLLGARKTIFDLKHQGYQLAIASNRPTRFTNIILKTLKVRPCFNFVVCADKVKNPKPSGDILRMILKKARLRPQEALYVGDMAIDIQAGKDAYVRTIAVTTGSSAYKEIKNAKPFKIFKSISEIKGFVSLRP